MLIYLAVFNDTHLTFYRISGKISYNYSFHIVSGETKAENDKKLVLNTPTASYGYSRRSLMDETTVSCLMTDDGFGGAASPASGGYTSRKAGTATTGELLVHILWTTEISVSSTDYSVMHSLNQYACDRYFTAGHSLNVYLFHFLPPFVFLFSYLSLFLFSFYSFSGGLLRGALVKRGAERCQPCGILILLLLSEVGL